MQNKRPSANSLTGTAPQKKKKKKKKVSATQPHCAVLIATEQRNASAATKIIDFFDSPDDVSDQAAYIHACFIRNCAWCARVIACRNLLMDQRSSVAMRRLTPQTVRTVISSLMVMRKKKLMKKKTRKMKNRLRMPTRMKRALPKQCTLEVLASQKKSSHHRVMQRARKMSSMAGKSQRMTMVNPGPLFLLICSKWLLMCLFIEIAFGKCRRLCLSAHLWRALSYIP